jgi:hypothetical protein
MIRELEFTWQVITDDPLLRLELASIEEEENDEQLAELLVGFFGKVDAIVRLGVEILEEDMRQETGDMRQETLDRRQETGDVRLATA